MWWEMSCRSDSDNTSTGMVGSTWQARDEHPHLPPVAIYWTSTSHVMVLWLSTPSQFNSSGALNQGKPGRLGFRQR